MMEYFQEHNLTIDLILIILSLLFSAFFSASETAITSLSFPKIKELLSDKNKKTDSLILWLKDPAKVLTSILIGNNIANILASSLMTVISKSVFKDNAVAISVGIMTLLILTFSEIMPKIFARANSEKFSIFAMRFLKPFYYLFYPLNYFFINILGKLFKTEINIKGHPIITIKDIDSLISIADEEGTLDDSPRASYLKAIIDFSESKVRNVMIPENQIKSLSMQDNIDDIIKKIQEEMHSRYPVINEKDDFIGFLHVKDLLTNMESCKEKNSFTHILRPTLFINEYMKIDEVLELMKRKKTQMFLVKDEYNEISGLITMEDIIEELLGEIEDEHDEDENNIQTIDDKTIRIHGTEPIHDLNLRYDFNFPEDKDFTTINGFILSILDGHLPEKNISLNWENIELKVLKTKDKNIEEIEIRILESNEKESN